jgi:hypothetical protein
MSRGSTALRRGEPRHDSRRSGVVDKTNVAVDVRCAGCEGKAPIPTPLIFRRSITNDPFQFFNGRSEDTRGLELRAGDQGADAVLRVRHRP